MFAGEQRSASALRSALNKKADPTTAVWLFFGGFGEGFGGVAFYANFVPDFFDFTVGADQKGAADDAEKGFAEKFFHAARSVGFDSIEFGIAEEREIQFLFLLETGQGLHGIGADAEDDDVLLVQFRAQIAEIAGFDGAAGGVGFGIEIEQDALAFEVSQGDFFAFVGFEVEVGGFVAFF